VGFAISVFNVLVISLRQALIPERLFGRVQGAYRTLVWGLIPLGALSGGLLAKFSSVPITFVISGIAQLMLTVLCWRLFRRHREQIQAAYQLDPEPAASESR